MTALSDHPMDEFPVRPLTFDVDAIETHEAVWSRSSPMFAVFINALGIHVPYFERYPIAAMRRARPHVEDPELARDMTRIIGQEAHHARNFVRLNQLLAQRCPKVARLDEKAKTYFARHAEEDSLKQLVGFTAGCETSTFLAGLITLDDVKDDHNGPGPMTGRTGSGRRHRPDGLASTHRATTGITSRLRKVEVTSPPITTMAMGALKLGSLPRPSAIGSIPAPIARVVMTIGRARFRQASMTASTRFKPSCRWAMTA